LTNALKFGYTIHIPRNDHTRK